MQEIYYFEDVRSFITLGAFRDFQHAITFYKKYVNYEQTLNKIRDVDLNDEKIKTIFKELRDASSKNSQIYHGFQRNIDIRYLNTFNVYGSGANFYFIKFGEGNGSYGAWTEESEMEQAFDQLKVILDDYEKAIRQLKASRGSELEKKRIDRYDLLKLVPERKEQLMDWVERYQSHPGDQNADGEKIFKPGTREYEIESLLINYFLKNERRFRFDMIKLQGALDSDDITLQENKKKGLKIIIRG